MRVCKGTDGSFRLQLDDGPELPFEHETGSVEPSLTSPSSGFVTKAVEQVSERATAKIADKYPT